MGRATPDLTGQVFARWTVLSRAQSNAAGSAYWKCRCVCGVERDVRSHTLVHGKSDSCGCLAAELSSERWIGQKYSTIHGMANSKVNMVWNAMVGRCHNPNNPSYENYGGRGITVSDEWREFANFYRDMGEPNGLTLERLDNDKGYSKDNCVWETRTKQARNTRTNVIYEINQDRRCLAEWVEKFNLDYLKTWQALARGETLDTLIKLPTI
jgi:hypothetical protein